MTATPGQRKLLKMILETRELSDEVFAVSTELIDDREMSPDEARGLIRALLAAPDGDEMDWRVGGIIKT